MQSKLFVCAEDIITEEKTNRLYIHNVFEEIASPVFPIVLQKIFFLQILERTLEEPEILDFNLLIKVDNDEIFRMSIPADFNGKIRQRIIIKLATLAIPRPGILRIIFRRGKEELGIYEILTYKISR